MAQIVPHVTWGYGSPPGKEHFRGLGKHGHARSVYIGAWIFGATVRRFIELLRSLVSLKHTVFMVNDEMMVVTNHLNGQLPVYVSVCLLDS